MLKVVSFVFSSRSGAQRINQKKDQAVKTMLRGLVGIYCLVLIFRVVVEVRSE